MLHPRLSPSIIVMIAPLDYPNDLKFCSSKYAYGRLKIIPLELPSNNAIDGGSSI